MYLPGRFHHLGKAAHKRNSWLDGQRHATLWSVLSLRNAPQNGTHVASQKEHLPPT